MSAEDFKKYSPTDPELIDKIVNNIKAQGLFDQFRRDCLADVDTKPAYQNLKQRVNGSVTGFLSSQKWQGTLNKTQLRESLRKHTVQQGFLEVGVDRIVDQVVNPKIYSVFTPKVEDVVYECLGIEKPKPKPKPLLLDFQAFKKSLTPMKSASLKPEMTEDTQVPSVKETEEIPDVKVEPDEPKEPPKETEIPSEMEKLPESTSTPPPLNDLEVSEPPQDIGPGTPPRVPEVNNDVNNDDDSNTIDEMPLIAASLDQDSNRATTPVNSLPHPNNIGADMLSEASASQSIVVTRPRSEYDSSTNNLSLKSVDKISPSKKFDNFSNLGEKLKQSDMNLRETSASKNDIVTEESSELTKSSENDSESYETKVDPPSESNMSSLDNTRYEPIRDDGTSVDKIFSDDSSSSLVSTKSRSRADDVKESKIREKHSERKSTSSKSRDKSKPSRERDSSVDKDPNDKRDRHNSSKSTESKAKDEGKEKSKESKHKSDKHKSIKEKTSRSSDLQSKSELEKERKEKKDKGESDDKKSEKRKHESKVSENGKESDKKRKDDDRSHHNHEKNRKSDGKIKSEKDKKDKDKSKSEGKFKSDSASKSSHKSSDKYSKDEKRGKSEGSKKESKKRTREQCDEDDFKSKHSRRSSDRDSNGNADTGTNKNKSGGSLHSSRQSSKGDKGRKHSKKESNPSEAVEELHSEELVTDEIDLIMMQINNSIEDEQQRFNVRELLGEPNVKKPKIASNFQEIKKVMQARKHIDKINSEVNVDQLSDEEYLSQQDTENEPADADQVENVGLKKFSLVITDMLKKPDSRYLPSLKDKCLELDGKSAEKLTTGVSVILGEDDEILSVDQNESGTSESCTSPNSKESIIERAELKKLTDEDIVVSGDARKFEVCSTRSQASESEELEAKSSASRRQTRSGSSKSESCKKGFEDSSRSTGNIARVDKSSESHMRSKSNPCIESGDTVDEEKADAHESEDASDKRISDSYNRHTRSRTSSAGSKDGETETNRDIRSAQSSFSNSPVPCRSSSRKNAGNRLHAILEEVGGPKFQTPLLEKAKRKAPKDEATERSGLVGQMSAIINPDDCSDVSNKENDEAKASGACKINNSKTEEVLPDASHNETRSMRRKPIDSSMRGTGEDMSKLSASTTRTTSRRSTVTPLNSRNETLSVTTPGSPEHEPERMADKVKNEGIRKSMECLQMDKENTLTPLSSESTSPSQVRNIASPNHRRKSCSDVFQRRVSLDQNEPPSSADDSTQGIVDITENEEIGGRLEPKVNLPNSPTDSSMVKSNEAPVALGHRTRGKALKFDGPRFGRNVKRHAANESSLETRKPPLAKSTAELDTLVVDAVIQSSDQTEGRSEDSNMAAAQDPVSTEHEELTDHIECRTRGINKRRKSTVDEKKKRSVSQKNTEVTAILPDSNKDLNPTSSAENNSSSQSDDKTNTKEKMISGKKIEKSESQRSKKNRYPNATDELTSPQSSQLSPKKVGIGNISTSGLSCRKLQVSTEPQSPSVDSSMRASEFKPEMTYFSDDDLNDEINEDFRGFSDEQIHKAVVQLELLKKFISQSAFSQQPQTVDDKPKAKKTRVSSEQSLSTDLPAAIRTSSRIPRKRKLSLHTSPGKDKKNDLVGQCKAESKDSGLSESPEQPSFTLEEVPKITTTLRHSSGNNGQRTRKVPEPMVNGDSPKTMKQCHEKAKDEGITSIKKAVIGTRSSQRYSASDLYKPRPSFTRDSKNTPSPRITTVGRSKKSS